MQEAIETSAACLREAGAEVKNVLLPAEFALTWPAHRLISGAEGATYYADRLVPGSQPGTTTGTSDRRPASLVPATYYLQAQRIRRWLYTKLLGPFQNVDAFLMAVAPGPAPKGLASTGDASLLAPWSFLGYPAIAINGGLSPEGLPLGLQFVAPPEEDYHLLQVGAWCEGVLGRLPVPPLA